jgi:hypothetical protein
MAKKDLPDADRSSEAEAAEEAPVQEYPKMLYHADGRTLTVVNKDAEDAAAKDGFTETPGGEPASPKARDRG